MYHSQESIMQCQKVVANYLLEITLNILLCIFTLYFDKLTYRVIIKFYYTHGDHIFLKKIKDKSEIVFIIKKKNRLFICFTKTEKPYNIYYKI